MSFYAAHVPQEAKVFAVPANFPRRQGRVLKFCSQYLLRLTGWRIEGELPDVSKLVMAVAPHSSNWDFVIGVLGMCALDLKLRFMAKHTLFIWPFSLWLRALGGIPVDRRSSHGAVGGVIAAFATQRQMVLAIAPEGTRNPNARFKTGFLHMARGAQVPILLTYFDYSRRVIGFGRVLKPSDDPQQDLQQIIALYRPIRGKYKKVWQS